MAQEIEQKIRNAVGVIDQAKNAEAAKVKKMP